MLINGKYCCILVGKIKDKSFYWIYKDKAWCLFEPSNKEFTMYPSLHAENTPYYNYQRYKYISPEEFEKIHNTKLSICRFVEW